MGNLGGDINTGTLPGGEYIPNGGVNTGGTGGTGGTGTGGATGGGFDFNTFLQQWMQSIMPGASPQGQSIENPNQRRKINEIQAKIDDGTYTGYHLKLAQDKIEELRNDPALRQFPSRSINLVDTRTPFMQGLEFLSAPMMAGMLTQPGQTFGQMFGGSQVPGMAGFDQNNPAMAAYKGAPKNPFGDLLGLLGSVGGGSIGINDHSGPGGGTVTPGGGGQLPNPYDPLNPYDPGGGGSMLINQGGGQGGFDPGSTINTGITPPGPGGGTVTPTLPGGGTTGGTGGTGGTTGGGGLPPDGQIGRAHV